MAKPRQTRSDKWKKRKCVLEYRAFCDELRLKLRDFKLGDSYSVEFGLPMPKSFSKKKRLSLAGKPHQSKPDLDNLVKALNDALRSFGEDDSSIFEISAKKVWDEEGFITLNNRKQ